MALNAWGEPKPERLSGEQADAWALIMTNAEWFDGEDAIAYGAQQRFLAEWRENKPATVYIRQYGTNVTATRPFPDTRRAYRAALRLMARREDVYVSVSVDRK